MSRIIRGTLDARRGKLIQKQAAGGVGRMRCPACHGLAVDAIDTRTGRKVKRCGTCGRQYTSKPM